MSDDDQPRLALFPPAVDSAPTLPNGAQTRNEIRVLTWNVQHASRARTHRQMSWLCTRARADVIVLTEVAARQSGDLMAQWLEESGYTVHLPDAGTDDRYRVLLACHSGAIERVGIGAVCAHRCVAARVKVAQVEIGVVGLYVPSRGPRERRNVAKRAFQDAVVEALPKFAVGVNQTGPVMVVGDLNVVEPDHVPHYSVFGDWEYNFYRAFAEHGFVDAFRLMNPGGIEYSWFGRPSIDGRRNGYRFDHIFVTTAHRNRIRACRYLHEVRSQGLSDHSAMVATFAS